MSPARGPVDAQIGMLLSPVEQRLGSVGGTGVPFGESGEEGRAVGGPPRRRRPLRALGGLGVSDHARDDRLVSRMVVDVLLDLDGQHLRLGHLAIEELDDPAQLGRDDVRDEDQPEPLEVEVRSDGRPEGVWVLDAQRVRQRLGSGGPARLCIVLKPGGHSVRR